MTMARSRLTMFALVLLAVALSANAQVTSSSATAQWPPALRERVDRIADSAKAQRLPTDPLYSKAAEGVLKGADEARIVQAVGRLAQDLRDARSALGSSATDAELVAAASVIHSGMDVQTLRKFFSTREARPPSESFVMPLVVLSDLLARRVTQDVATTSLSNLLEHGAKDAELTALRRDIERDITRGQSPDVAARLRTDAALATLPSVSRQIRRPPNEGAS
jgi:hypothetical protein